MTYRNKLIALSATAGALALAILLSFVLSPQAMQRRSSAKRILSDSDAKAVSGLDLSVGGAALSIRKGAEGWVMEREGVKYPASATKVETFLSAVRKARTISKAGSNRESWADFGLEGAQARTVVFLDSKGQELTRIVLGSSAGSTKEIFLAMGDSGAVHRAQDSFGSYLRLEDDAWGELRLFDDSLAVDDVQGISLLANIPALSGQAPKMVDYQLTRNKKEWKLSGDDAAVLDTKRVNDFLDAIITAQGDSFAKDATGLGAPAARFSLTDGRRNVVRVVDAFFREASNDFILTVDSSGFGYVMNSSIFTPKVKAVDELKLEAVQAE